MDYITLALAKDYADQVAAGGGSGSADLKNYYKKDEVDNKLNEKVDKVTGKGLSTEDFTSEEKTKLAGLSNYNDTEIKTSLNLKADASNVYTKAESDEKLSLVQTKAPLPIYVLSTENITTNFSNAFTQYDFSDEIKNKIIEIITYEINNANLFGFILIVNGYPLTFYPRFSASETEKINLSLHPKKISWEAILPYAATHDLSGTLETPYLTLAVFMAYLKLSWSGDIPTIQSGYLQMWGYQSKGGQSYPSLRYINEYFYNKTNIDKTLKSYAKRATTLSGYGITDAYTKEEVNNMISGAFHFQGSKENYESLPTDANQGDVYQVGDKEYAWNGTEWVELGSNINLSGYLTAETANQTYATKTELNAKVDKVEGKGLSTNDFTDDLNTKLAGIAAGAEVNTINTVKLNGETLTVTDKSVNIEVPIPQAQDCEVIYNASDLPINVVNGANGFTQKEKSFSAIASSGTTYETTITINKENISTIVLSTLLAQHNSNNQTSTKFIETGCVAKIELLHQGQSQTITEVSTIGQSVLIERAINGMQIKLTLQCSDNSKDVMFKVNIENYGINKTTNDILAISDSGDMYFQTMLKQKTAELQTQIDWINNDTSKDMQVVPLYDTQASANLTMLNNTEYRIETHSGTSTLNINFEEDFETVDTATYKSVLILRTGTNDNDSCTVAVPEGVILQGDDVTNNILTTQKLKVYEISFNWHGFMMVGLVKGFSYPAPLA